MRRITQIYLVDWLGDSPARVDRKTGAVYLNAGMWDKLPREHRVFILLHEWGHVALNTSNELAVDEFAHKLYMQMGYSLSKSITALTHLLRYDDWGEQLIRTQRQYNRAAEYDYYVNGNTKVLEP